MKNRLELITGKHAKIYAPEFKIRIEKRDSGVYTVQWGSVELKDLPIHEYKLILINYRADIIIGEDHFTNSTEMINAYKHAFGANDSTKIADIRKVVNERFLPDLDSIAKDIANENPGFFLMGQHSVMPYRNLLVRNDK